MAGCLGLATPEKNNMHRSNLKMRPFLPYLVCVICFLVLLSKHGAAQIQSQEPLPAEPSLALQHKGLSAVIVAPNEILLHKSRSFSIAIRVFSVDGSELPKVVTVTSFGVITSEGETANRVLNIKLKNGRGTALISFPEMSDPTVEPEEIEVTTADTPRRLLGRTQVLIREQKNLEIAKAPLNLIADGKTTAKLRVGVKDQLGQPLEGVPFLVRSVISGMARKFFVVWSDANGIATYTTPTVSNAGVGLFQFEGEKVASDQIRIVYEEPAVKNAVTTPGAAQHPKLK